MILGKSKLLKLINELLEKEYKLKECNYEKYRKSEWLNTGDIKVFNNSNNLLIDFLKYDEENNKEVSINTISYHLNEGKWIKIYDRNQMIKKYKRIKI